jgi:hypothetical protein
MQLTISIPPEPAEKIETRAAAAGQDVTEFIRQHLKWVTEPPMPLEELSGPIYRRFQESGMSDEYLTEELERAKHEMRIQRRNRAR